MIAYLRGTMTSSDESGVVIDCGGVGFYVYSTQRDIETLLRSGKMISPDDLDPGHMTADQNVLLHTHLQIREDERVLFGFLEKSDLHNFKKLITVTGVGPKVALAILNTLSAEDLFYAVQSGDAKTIAKANGVGAKTAQRVVLELKDAIEFGGGGAADFSTDVSADADPGASNAVLEVTEALISLGYSRSEALRAVRRVEKAETMTTEALLSAALKKV